MAIFLAAVAFVASAMYGLGWWVNWHTHVEMVRENARHYGRGSMQLFLREFARHEWTRDERWPRSYFDHTSDSEIHASIIRFDGRGMIIPFWQWPQLESFLRRGKLVVARNDVDWSKER